MSNENNDKAIWSTKLETINADKMNLFMYFQVYALDVASVPDTFLETVCRTALEVTPSSQDALPVSPEMN